MLLQRFNPSQVGYKLLWFQLELDFGRCFNPSQVGYKRGALRQGRLILPVSIPHR